MRIANETDLLQGYVVTSREPPQPEMSLVVRGSFPLDAEGQLLMLEGLAALEARGALNADAFADEDEERAGALLRASDFAEFKPRAEVLIYGSCHLPGRVTSTRLTVGVGNWSKTIIVNGDRRWQDGKPSRPALFDSMPLDFTRAFGGQGSLTNPVGIGIDDGRLPNLEFEHDRMQRPESRPAPAAMGPVNPAWPTRRAKLGENYGPDYVRKRAPYKAEDFDWTYFMAAPSDQWLPGGYLKGDERIVAHNLFASHPELDTRLPGLRVRAFMRDDALSCREIKLNLDTVVFDGDRELIELSWRGLAPVRERDLEDVTHLYIAAERLDAPPRPAAEYEAKLAVFAADPTGYEKALEDTMTVEPVEGIDPLTQRLLERGLPLPPQAQEELKRSWQVMTESGADTDTLLEQLDAQEPDGPPEEPPPAVPAWPDIPPRVFLRPQLQLAQEQVARVRSELAPGAELPEEVAIVERRLADPKLRETDPTFRDIADGEPAPGADLSGQDLTDRDLSGANLRGAKLDGCVCIRTNFAGADLVGASLDGAMLFRADFTRAFMTEADLSRCNAAYGTFVGAQLDGATLDGGYFDHANFTDAKLDGAKGAIVNFTAAVMPRIRAEGLQLTKSEFKDARLEGADLRGGKLEGCRFQGAKAPESRFDGAELTQAVFSEGDLSGTSFFKASLAESVWLETDLSGADFGGAVIPKSHFTKANLEDARFEAADLRESRFYRCKLLRTDFSRSNLHGADLCQARLGYTSFVRANLYDAKLIDAKGPGCDFSGANLERTRIDEGQAR